ncbi:MAG: hypothetical protein K0R34_192 [Herbinix sp.]|jgi:hypothetical protein|nr:hypothetical protein [Herbinix sp.]
MINPAKLFKMKSLWERFVENHPRFPQFMSAVQSTGIEEGSVIEIIVTTPEGKNISTNVKVTASDKEMFTELAELSK